MAFTCQIHKRSWSLPEKLSFSRHRQSVSTPAISSPIYLNIKEAAGSKMWPFLLLKSKSKPKSLTESLLPMTPIQEDLDVAAQSSSRVRDAGHEELNEGAPLTQLGPQDHSIIPGVGFNTVSRKRSSTEPRKSSGGTPATADPSESSQGPSRPVTELEYLTSSPPSARELPMSDSREAQLGREDAWILLMQMKREQEDLTLPAIAGNLLFALEQHHYPGGVLFDLGTAAELSIRQEAMLEEAGNLVRMYDTKLMEVVEKARMVEARRRKGSGRRTM